ncbi:MAG: AraC family transcriptional regulator [Gemmatimonadaceae bacterium]|jgi:AraC family transcriptional regulator|nr:AraC family transcriptional regulator [Gemmatimonadaceae bacterium]
MKVEVVDRPALRLASVRHIGSYMNIREAFGRLNDLVTAAGLSKPDTMLVGIYHDDPSSTPEEKLRSDAAVTIPAKTKLPPGLSELVIPAGRYAHATHLGPYTGLGDTYAHLRNEWLPRSGEKLGKGMSYEMYRNTPMTAKPDELVTDIYLALE